MSIILTPEQERVLIEAINSGLAQSKEEALDQALDTLRRRMPEYRSVEAETNTSRARAFERWARNHPKPAPTGHGFSTGEHGSGR